MSFSPQLTPREMLERGIFGGGYFNKATLADLDGLGLPYELLRDNSGPPAWGRNYYGVRSGMTHEQWVAKGWIFPEDPLGWFHWYCRYSAGRRHMRDAHQIRRQQRFLAATSRFGGLKDTPTIRQSLLQWAYDPEKIFSGNAL